MYYDPVQVSIDRVARGRYTRHDLQVIRSALRQTGSGAVQIGRYNVRLDHARNIHIGDRIYQGAEADTLRHVIEDLGGVLPPGFGQGSLRSVGGFVYAIGMIIACAGFIVVGVNGFEFVDTVMSAGTSPRWPDRDVMRGVFLGMGVVMGGAMVGVLGTVIRGLERPTRR